MRDFLRRPGFFPLGQDNRNQDTRGQDAKRDIPEDLWTKCPKCSELLYTRELEDNQKVCQKCGFHFRLSSRERIDYTLDPGSFQEEDPEVFALDPISFTSADERYSDKLVASRQKTGLADAVVIGTGTIDDVPTVFAVVDFRFMGGSMGSVYGEKIRRATCLAREKKLGLVTVSSSGGARMQEGVFSLMQMAKTSAAAVELSEARLPFISILADPCTGGVTASYATSADVVIGESGALIGFAGPRVIAQTIRQKLPPGFQTAEFQMEHGMLDMVLPRRELRPTVSRLLKMYRNS